METVERTKRCTRCGKHKTLDEFSLERNGLFGRRGNCRVCRRNMQAEKKEIERDLGIITNSYKNHIKFEYKNTISIEDVQNKYNEQNGKCAICEKIIDLYNPIDCHIDHDHVIYKFRGLLCSKCNKGLGFFEENVRVFEAAIEYLERNRRE